VRSLHQSADGRWEALTTVWHCRRLPGQLACWARPDAVVRVEGCGRRAEGDALHPAELPGCSGVAGESVGADADLDRE
jgi:hypothetical protein